MNVINQLHMHGNVGFIRRVPRHLDDALDPFLVYADEDILSRYRFDTNTAIDLINICNLGEERELVKKR